MSSYCSAFAKLESIAMNDGQTKPGIPQTTGLLMIYSFE